jgi:acetolactate synthase-1/2/3 large subunit
MTQTAAQLVIKCLEAQGVEFIYGIPGAKIDTVFDAIVDSNIRLILCRHEQNAAFMAAAYGRKTGKPGVVLVTSGPGVANLPTGLLTATTEGDPIVALGGNVGLDMKFKETHQNTDNAKLLEPVTKSSIEVTRPEVIPEAIANAFRLATAPKSGACFISLPQDVLKEQTTAQPCHHLPQIAYGHASTSTIDEACKKIASAKQPILFVGQEATRDENTKAIIDFVKKHKIPVISTYQGAGVIPKDLVECFYGRVGLFKNQPGDRLLAKADVVITVGYNLFEYDPEIWNADMSREIVHIDYTPANIHNQYQPSHELLGNIHENIEILSKHITSINVEPHPELHQELFKRIDEGKDKVGKNNSVHPLRLVYEINKIMDDDTIICCDIGSVYMWLARYLISHKPHQLLFSNGQQTLGVALPWGMGIKLAYPTKKIITVSGDGGFLFSAMELETAVREKIKLTHFVWRDGHYNMVQEQQIMKYKRESGVQLGAVDIPKFAEAFGTKGYYITNPDDITSTYAETLKNDLPSLIEVEVDYSDNMQMFTAAHDPELGN